MSDVKPESEEDRQKSCSVQSIPFLLMTHKKKKKKKSGGSLLSTVQIILLYIVYILPIFC